MTEQEFLKLREKVALQYLANCPDDEAIPLLLRYVEVKGINIDWMLRQVQRAKGDKPAYHEEAVRRWLETRDGGGPVSAEMPVLANRSYTSSSSAPPVVRSPMFGWGIALVVVSILAIIGSFFFDVSVETGEFERVANINLISIREMICWSGGFMFLGGLVLLAVDRVCHTISLANAGNLPNPAGD